SKFTRGSAGYVGFSDGWQDFNRNGRMTDTFVRAAEGNVAILGELAQNGGILALGLAETAEGAHTLALSSVSEGYEAAREVFVNGWEEWASNLKLPRASAAITAEAQFSATILKVHQGNTYPGSTVASLSIPWGNVHNSAGGYHLVWTRDAVE